MTKHDATTILKRDNLVLTKRNKDLKVALNRSTKWANQLLDSRDEISKTLQETQTELGTALTHNAEVNKQLESAGILVRQYKEEAENKTEVCNEANRLVSEYIGKLKEVKDELAMKETTLKFVENGLRSAENEVLTLRQANKNLLNYINLLASQDNPNVPKDFNY